MCERGSHPFADYCPYAHTEEEIRDVQGYYRWMDIPSQDQIEPEPNLEDPDSEEKPLDKVDDLPVSLPPKKKKGGMKKSVSMNVAGPGGMEGAFSSSKKNHKKKKNKSKKSIKSIKSIRSQKTTDGRSTDAILYLDLKTFKVNQCTAGTNHNPKKCLNYHDHKRDRRRPIGTYSSEPCKFAAKGECKLGDACKRAHNRVEEFYHPEKYKVKFCNKYPDDLDS